MIQFKDPSIPLYYQLENILREKINSGEYRPGNPFPTEDQLSKSYRVSRITIRKALSSLEEDGLINRRRGKGSFVESRQGGPETMKLTGMIEDIIAMGIKTRTKILQFGFVHPPPKVAEQFKLKEGVQMLRIEWIRVVKNGPFSYVIHYVPADLGKKIKPRDLAHRPLMNVLEEKCKVKISRGTQVIDATVADSRVASLLGVRTGTPLLKIERTVLDIKGKPVEYLTVLYRSDRYHYSVDLIRKKIALEPRWDFKKSRP